MKREKVSGRWRHLVATGTAGLTAGLGVVVLVGWYTHTVTLVQVLPTFVPMQYNTALGFLLSGAGLFLLVCGRQHLAMICGAAIAAIGLSTLTEYILGIDLGIDQLFMEHYITVQTSHPGRMAPNTALCFILTGTALLMLARAPLRLRSPVSGVLGSITGALGLVALCGYVSGISSAYGWGQLTSMAVHTAAGFVALGVGVVASACREATVEGTDTPGWLAVSAGIGVATLATALWQALDAQQHAAGVQSLLPQVALTTGLLMGFLVALTAHFAQAALIRAKRVESEEATRQALYRASIEIQESMELTERLNRLLETAKSVLELDRVNILLADPEGRWLQAVTSMGTTEPLEAIRVPVGPDGGAIAHAYLTKQSIFWDGQGSVPEEFRLKPPYDRIEAFRSRVFANVPLVAQGQAIGVMGADRKHSRRPLEPATRELLQLFAAQAAVAIENARLFEGVESTNRRLAALNQVAQTVNRSLHLQDILEASLDAVLGAVEVEAGNIRLWNEREGFLTLAAHRGMSEWYVSRMRHFTLGEGVAGKVFQTGEAFLVEDLGQHPELNQMAQRDGVRSVASIPIRSRDKVVGVMSILSHGQRRFTPAETDLLTAIGNQIGTAIENAGLYQEVRAAALELEATVEARTLELQRTNVELRQALQRAEEASRAKSQFLATMSHELRTPLNPIIGFSELLEDQQFGGLTEKQRQYVSRILTSARHLLTLINDVLDLAKVEAGSSALDFDPLHLPQALKTSYEGIRPHAAAKGIDLYLNIESAPQALVADAARIRQILDHLLSNAIKFTPPGGKVTLSARRVQGSGCRVQGEAGPNHEPSTMNHERHGDFAEIAVSDTGIGIKAEEVSKLFRPFTQLDASLTRKHQGTGLGLALTKKLVELHGGTIRAESNGPNQGSTFTVTLPLEVLAGDQVEAQTPQSGTSTLPAA
jgi:signal transduction histidine kinase